MTLEKDELLVVEKIVVTFDMCSSSTIIEDLTLRNNLKPLRNLLIQTKNFLRRESKAMKFLRYKFVGDGWVLLFRPDVSGSDLMAFLTRLSERFETPLTQEVLCLLDDVPDITGLTFGVDRGRLVQTVMDNKREYLVLQRHFSSRFLGC